MAPIVPILAGIGGSIAGASLGTSIAAGVGGTLAATALPAAFGALGGAGGSALGGKIAGQNVTPTSVGLGALGGLGIGAAKGGLFGGGGGGGGGAQATAGGTSVTSPDTLALLQALRPSLKEQLIVGGVQGGMGALGSMLTERQAQKNWREQQTFPYSSLTSEGASALGGLANSQLGSRLAQMRARMASLGGG